MRFTSQEDTSTAAQCLWSDKIVTADGSKGLWEIRWCCEKWKFNECSQLSWGRRKQRGKKKKVSQSDTQNWNVEMLMLFFCTTKVCSHGCTFSFPYLQMTLKEFFTGLNLSHVDTSSWIDSIYTGMVAMKRMLPRIRQSETFHCLISES